MGHEKAMIASIIYGLCGLTSVLSAGLLWRSYLRSRYRLLLWSALCFTGLTLANILLMMDKLIFPDVDLLQVRLIASLVALLPLLYGLITDE
jgi:hypothetical protein